MSRVSPLRAAHRWLFEPRPIHPLVSARIIFGFALFFCYLVRWPDAEILYGPTGLLGPGLIQSTQPLLPHTRWLASQLEAVVPPLSTRGLATLYALLLLSSFCFAVGFRTRTAGVVTLLLHVFLLRGRNPFAYWGWAWMIQPYLAYVLLAPTGRFLSVDAWLKSRRRGAPLPAAAEWVCPAWPLRLLQVHVCTMYAVSAWPRIDDPGWLRGEIVYAAVANALFGRLLIDWQPFKPLLAYLTYVAFVLEPLAPILLWLRTVGPWWAYAMIALHLGLEVLTNLGWWSFVMIAGLLCFVPTAHLQAVLGRLPGGPRERAQL